MSRFVVSAQEELLLNAALNVDIERATQAWSKWASTNVLEEAPYPELRMLPAVHARLSMLAPLLPLPQKLRGKARATFTRNQLLAHGSLPALQALSGEMPLMLIKGAALCARFGTWSSRAMGDIDVLLPMDRLARAAELLAEAGWIPKYGMTWASLVRRSALRRNSWNISKENADVDVHWRFLDDAPGEHLDAQLWAAAQQTVFFDLNVTVPSPESAVATSLRHGFLDGTQGDRLQTTLDVAAYLPLCDFDRLSDMLSAADLWDISDGLQTVLARSGFSEALPIRPSRLESSQPKVRRGPPSIPPSEQVERDLLHRPRLYQAWERLGRRASLERWAIRHFGPFSKPLSAAPTSKSDFDLRDCSVLDEVAGPGWGWPEPEHSCFWTDRADSRLLLPLHSAGEQVVMLSIHDHRSPNSRVFVFANGRLISALNLSNIRSGKEYALFIPRKALFGNWVELSFRPQNYLGDMRTSKNYAHRRSMPAAWVRVFDAERLGLHLGSNAVSSLGSKAIVGDGPHAAIFLRIRKKMAASTYKDDPRLPVQFDPIAYVLWYDDLFFAEVDPFEHFVKHGQREGRSGS